MNIKVNNKLANPVTPDIKTAAPEGRIAAE